MRKLLAILLLCIVVAAGFGLLQHTHGVKAGTSPSITYKAGRIPVGGKVLAPVMKGAGDARSAPFTAPTSWHVYWSFLCSNEEQPGSLIISVIDVNGRISTLNKPIDARGISGYGDQPYNQAGRFYLEVMSTSHCNWQITTKAGLQTK